MNADAVVFDMDGVLVDSRWAFADGINTALAGAGLPPRTVDELEPFLGPSLHGTLEGLAPGHDVDALVDAYRARYCTHGIPMSALFEGVAEALDVLAARLPLVVATSKAQLLAVALLEHLGVAGRFCGIVGPALGARDEPKAETVGRALAFLDGARSPVMVGDRRYDVIGAEAHGLPCVGVLWGAGTAEELRAAGATALVATPAELMATLLRAAA